MNSPFVIFWAALIFGSIAWYGFLVFYVGVKAGREIIEMTKTLGKRRDPNPAKPEPRNQRAH